MSNNQVAMSNARDAAIAADTAIRAAESEHCEEVPWEFRQVLVTHVAAIISRHCAASTEYAAGVRDAARVANLWAMSHSCDSHDYDPCCHVRTGAAIEERIRALAPAVVATFPNDSKFPVHYYRSGNRFCGAGDTEWAGETLNQVTCVQCLKKVISMELIAPDTTVEEPAATVIATQSVIRRCVKCGHNNLGLGAIYCAEWVAVGSFDFGADDIQGGRECGCPCVFPSATDDVEELARRLIKCADRNGELLVGLTTIAEAARTAVVKLVRARSGHWSTEKESATTKRKPLIGIREAESNEIAALIESTPLAELMKVGSDLPTVQARSRKMAEIDGRKTGLSTQGFPLRKIVERVNGIHVLACGHRLPKPAEKSDYDLCKSRRCVECGPLSKAEIHPSYIAVVAAAQSTLATELLRVVEAVRGGMHAKGTLEVVNKADVIAAIRARCAELKVEVKDE